MKVVRVWDLPTRLFHWALVICFTGLFITGKAGGSAMDWHFRLAYVMASLLLFRLIWGLIGGHWSRFSSFASSPRSLIDYLKGQGNAGQGAGHNPLGAWSVFAMLFFLLAQVGTGLFAEDKGDAFGPLSKFVSGATVRLATGYHKNVGQTVLLVLVVLHLAAIAFYYFLKRDNLVKPMVAGDKLVAANVNSSRDDALSRIVGALVLLACAGVVAWVVGLAG